MLVDVTLITAQVNVIAIRHVDVAALASQHFAGEIIKSFIFCVIFLVVTTNSQSKEPRSKVAITQFKKEHPCPVTGDKSGSCPGYVIDHRISLCVGGKDDSSNMRWMTKSLAKEKDRWECKSGWEKNLMECEKSGCFEMLAPRQVATPVIGDQ